MYYILYYIIYETEKKNGILYTILFFLILVSLGIDYIAIAPVTANFSSSIPEHCIHVMTLDRAAGGDVFNVSLSLNTAQRVFIDGPITVNLINASLTNEPTLSTGSGAQSSYQGECS